MTEVNIQQLLDELCVRLGFCLPPKVQKRLVQNPPIEPKRFCEVVIKAEGLDPSMIEKKLYRDVLSMVETAFSKGERIDT